MKRPALWEAGEDAGKAGGHKQQDGHGGKIRNKKAAASGLGNRLVW